MKLVLLVFTLFLFSSTPAWAIQAHGAPEGLYAHQFAHLAFIGSMGILIYWLRARRLVVERPWRDIQMAAVFLILWSTEAFAAHLLAEQSGWIRVTPIGTRAMRIDAVSGWHWLAGLYYFLRLDHLLLVPGMWFLYRGITRLADRYATESDNPGETQ